MIIATNLNDKDIVKLLIEYLQISPFLKILSNENAFSYACLKDREEIIDLILSYKFSFKDDSLFDWSEQLN